MTVNNYLYRYADGTTGSSPYKLDANGNILKNSAGGILEEGSFLGRTLADGSTTTATLGNVTHDGMVHLYGDSWAPADQYYSGANANVFGGRGGGSVPMPTDRPTNGYGYSPTPAQSSGGASGGAVFGPGASGSGTAGAGTPGAGSTPAGQNPYLKQMGDVLAQQMTDNFQTRVAPSIASQAMASGGYGGSRQGVMEANANNDLQQQIGSALTNLYGQGYNNTLNYDLGLRNNALGYGQLGLGYANLDRNINNDNWANQLQGMNVGLNIWDRLQGNNQAAIGAGNTIQNTPMDYWNQFSQGANSIGQGYGTQTQSGQRGNPMLGALGGAQLGGQLANWWGGGSSSNSWAGMPNQNVYMGTGSMGD